MDSNQFHGIDPEELKNITIEEIQSGKTFPNQKLDYSIPVPTQDQSIPHSKQDIWLTVELGRDSSILPESDSGHRGRLGGC